MDKRYICEHPGRSTSSRVTTSLITPLTPLHPTVQSVSSAALYCRCINTRPMVQQKRIRRLEVFPPAPHCSQTEIISGGGGCWCFNYGAIYLKMKSSPSI
uniref:Chemokine interleukin-8-like domain-containing protein n=1 Tax=Paramormyrops kingsleyae TaxID=1676925 RepID=A0A3B3T347_9TELE